MNRKIVWFAITLIFSIRFYNLQSFHCLAKYFSTKDTKKKNTKDTKKKITLCSLCIFLSVLCAKTFPFWFWLVQVREIQAQNSIVAPQITLSGFNGYVYTLWDSVGFYKNGKSIDWPFTGGFNSSQFFQCKLNSDNYPDMVVFDRDGNILTTFINTGKSEILPFRHAPEYAYTFPLLYNWINLYDFNCDGYEDIFTSDFNNISVYKGIFKNNQLQFSTTSYLLKADSIPVFCASTDVPTFTDVDNDGDVDILAFDPFGTRVVFYKNLSKENYGNCDTLIFSSPNCWGNISEDFFTNQVNLNDSCSGGRRAKNVTGENNLHAGGTLLALDYDGDNDKDLLVGDISFSDMNLLTNGGNSGYANIISQNPTFPTPSDKVNIRTFPAAFLIDIDNDNVKDLVAAPNAPNASANINQIFTYKNISQSSVFSLQWLGDTLWSDKTIDVGTGAMPVFVDLDKDGLKDLLIGNQFYTYNNGKQTGQLMYFKNTGTVSTPAFTFVTDDYMSASSLEIFGLAPAFGDLDDDGDLDLILGDLDGHIHLFIDTAALNSPASFLLKAYKYKNIDAGNNAVPQIFDLNEDGKLDIVVGERGGIIKYYENTGTVSAPDFAVAPTNSFLGKVDVMKPCCTGYCAPLFLNTEGKIILLASSENGWIYEYDDISNNLSGIFHLIDSVRIPGHRIFLNMSDINGDTSPEMVIGNFGGGIFMYNISPNTSIKKEMPFQNKVRIFYYGNVVTLMLDSPINNFPIDVNIYNSNGSLVRRNSIISQSKIVRLQTGRLASGFYFVEYRACKGIIYGKFIVL